ncbi:N-ATPase, AtpR subunit [mine drainage metagenome]|uniref:N-ATPase, AtpR subunit n=1 Tax=mine drainage metagenome TaxID=410659 RepID=A0A1J5SRD2_9ZZZZ
MSEMLILTLVTIAGLFLGVCFFGSLWWTIRRGLTSKRPALLFIGSLLLRTSITLTSFYFIANGDLARLLMCLLGFIIGRFIMVRLVGLPITTPLAKETGYAP